MPAGGQPGPVGAAGDELLPAAPEKRVPGFKSPGLFALAPSVCGFVNSVVSLQVALPVCHFGQFSTRVLSRVSAGISLELFSGGPVQPAVGFTELLWRVVLLGRFI